MSILHLVSINLQQQPEQHQQLQECLGADDAILLLGYGLYSATLFHQSTHTCYALRTDVEVTGFKLPAQITIIDYPEFVRLSIYHDRCLSWN